MEKKSNKKETSKLLTSRRKVSKEVVKPKLKVVTKKTSKEKTTPKLKIATKKISDLKAKQKSQGDKKENRTEKGENVSKIENQKSIEIWNNVLRASLKIPKSRINREQFLRKELSKRVSPEKLLLAIQETPAKAKIDKKIIEEVANGCIKWQTLQVTAISFATGLPGGWWMAGTIPADLAQFYWQTIQLVQKLIYLYGWPELYEKEDDQIDDETLLRITIFIGVMFGASAASKVVSDLAEKLSIQVSTRLPKKALTKYGIYNLAKQVAKWIGVKITKTTFSRIASKAVPILSGFVSGGISFFSMKKMGSRLQKHLEKLPLAN